MRNGGEQQRGHDRVCDRGASRGKLWGQRERAHPAPAAAPHPQPAAGSRPRRRRLPAGNAASAPAARRDPTRCDSGAIARRAEQGAGTPPHPPGNRLPASAPPLRSPRSISGRAGRIGCSTGGWGTPQTRPCAPQPSGSPARGQPPKNVGRAALVAAASGHGPGAAVLVPVPAPVPVPVLGFGGAAGLPVPSGTKPRLFAEGTAARGRLIMRTVPAGVPITAGVPAPGRFSP